MLEQVDHENQELTAGALKERLESRSGLPRQTPFQKPETGLRRDPRRCIDLRTDLCQLVRANRIKHLEGDLPDIVRLADKCSAGHGKLVIRPELTQELENLAGIFSYGESLERGHQLLVRDQLEDLDPGIVGLLHPGQEEADLERLVFIRARPQHVDQTGGQLRIDVRVFLLAALEQLPDGESTVTPLSGFEARDQFILEADSFLELFDMVGRAIPDPVKARRSQFFLRAAPPTRPAAGIDGARGQVSLDIFLGHGTAEIIQYLLNETDRILFNQPRELFGRPVTQPAKAILRYQLQDRVNRVDADPVVFLLIQVDLDLT